MKKKASDIPKPPRHDEVVKTFRQVAANITELADVGVDMEMGSSRRADRTERASTADSRSTSPDCPRGDCEPQIVTWRMILRPCELSLGATWLANATLR